MPNPLEGARVRRSEYLADALQALQSQGQQSRTPGALGANLLASYLLNRQNNRALEEEQRAAEEADKPRREAQARLLGAFTGGGQPATPGQPQAVAMNAEGGGIAPMAPQGGAPSVPSLGDPAFMQTLIGADLAGVEGVDGIIRALEAGRPDITIADNGEAIDTRDRANIGRNFAPNEYVNNYLVNPQSPDAPRFLPTAPDGGAPTFGAGGSVTAFQPIPGYANVVGDVARAEADASNASEASYAAVIEQARQAVQAQYDLVEVQGDEGQTLTMPRATALALNLIEGQTPEDRETALIDGRTRGERQAEFPRAQGYVNDAARRDEIIRGALTRAQAILEDRGFLGEMLGFSGEAGSLGALMSAVPGTRAYDLNQALETVRAATGFDELQNMRDNSPTGGAVGQVAVQEGRWMQALRGSLDQGQSYEQLGDNIAGVLAELDNIARLRTEAFQRTYGDIISGGSGAQSDQPRRLRYNATTGQLEE